MSSNYERAQARPANYAELSGAEQWAIDRELRLLDWDGTDDRPAEPETRLFRLHRGGLFESMETIVEVADRTALVTHLETTLAAAVDPQKVDIRFYGFDDRIGWETWLVTIDGRPVGMTNGPL